MPGRVEEGVKLLLNLTRLIDMGLVEIVDEEPQVAKPKTPRPNGKHSWTARALEQWETRFGVGSGSGIGFGRIGRAFKRLIDAHGEESVLTAWDRYLQASEAQYASPESFTARYSEWANLGLSKSRPVPESADAIRKRMQDTTTDNAPDWLDVR